MSGVNRARDRRRRIKRQIERQRVMANVEAPHWSARGRRDHAKMRAQAGLKFNDAMIVEVRRRNR